MYLVIDQGNSFTKVAVFNGDELTDLETIRNTPMNQLIEGIKAVEHKSMEGKCTHGIFSTVLKDSRETLTYLNSRLELIEMTYRCSLPVLNHYQTPETLGNDRIAAVTGAFGLYPSTDLLVIDAGTCITYDFINAQGEYKGGGISPGIQMRFNALHTLTSKLPLVSLENDIHLIGNSTKGSILSGVINGTFAEVDGIIEHYRQLHPNLKVILTGGDTNYFDRKLKNNIFAVPNLVLMGLKDILLHNVEN